MPPEIEYDELQDILCHQTCYIDSELGENLSYHLTSYYAEEFCESY